MAEENRTTAGQTSEDVADTREAAAEDTEKKEEQEPAPAEASEEGVQPEEEQKGIIRHGAKLIYAYSEATVPKVTVITRKAYGGAYIAMCSKHLGADFVFAWPTAEIAVMGAEGAIQILYAKQLKDPSQAQMVQEKTEEYKNTIMTPKIAAKQGYISGIIEPEETRGKILSCFKFLEEKRDTAQPEKKHGNIPL